MGFSFLLPFITSSLLLHHASSMSLQFPLNVQMNPRGEFDAPLGRPRTKIFHPSTGFCVLRKHLTDPLKLGPCTESDSWSYTPQKYLIVKGTYYCLQAAGTAQPVKLSIICSPSDSQWKLVPGPKEEEIHILTELADGTTVCLDIDSDNTIVSNPCVDIGAAKAPKTDSQCFKMITDYNKVSSDEGLPLM